MEKIILILITLTAMVNFIGVLGPELSFDSLWYHLTLPKIYLAEKAVRFIPGGLLYYSAMPRLGEMFYTLSLMVSDERLAKFIHFSFGLLAAFITYKIAREFLEQKFSLLASLIFYSTLVIGWLSTTAYIDLFRTAFEAAALLFFIRWWKRNWENKGEVRNLFFSALFLGLAISTKLLAFGSVFIFILLIILKALLQMQRSPRRSQSRYLATSGVFFTSLYFILYALLPVLPWLVWAYYKTGNPIYPIGSGILDESHQLVGFSLFRFFADFWNLILKPEDPISPIFLIILPLGIIRLIKEIKEKKFNSELSLFLYGFLAYVVWYFTPRTGGGRFILPYLPAWSVLTAIFIKSLRSLRIPMIGVVLGISLIHMGYRFMANKKYLPYVLGKITKKEFLCTNLDFSTNVFYDCDGYFKKNLTKSDKVLIYCTHNLYYVNFPFIHESWLKPTDKFNYVMSQNCELPNKFKDLPLIYKNEKTGVELYKNTNLNPVNPD